MFTFFFTFDKKRYLLECPHAELKGDFLEMKFGTESDNDDSLFSLLSEIDAGRSFSQKAISPHGRNDSFLSSFLIQMIPAIKSKLGSIRNFALIPADHFKDFRLIRSFQHNIKDNVKAVDSVLNVLFNFINIDTPIAKGDTVYSILEEVLEANEREIENKHLRISRESESNLPETVIYDEQVKFILNSLLQYAILSTPVGGSIDFMLRTSDRQKVGTNTRALAETKGGFIEVRVSFSKNRQKSVQQNDPSGIPSAQKEGTLNLLLDLVREILEKNHGMLSREVDEQSLRTTITLRFPTERRKVVYYKPIAL